MNLILLILLSLKHTYLTVLVFIVPRASMRQCVDDACSPTSGYPVLLCTRYTFIHKSTVSRVYLVPVYTGVLLCGRRRPSPPQNVPRGAPVEGDAGRDLRAADGVLLVPRALPLRVQALAPLVHVRPPGHGPVLVVAPVRVLARHHGRPARRRVLDSDAVYVGWTVGLYWVPFAMQYTSYSVFCLFLGKVVYREHWKRHRWKRMFISGFSLTNFLMFVFILVWATRSALIVIGHNERPASPHVAPGLATPSPSALVSAPALTLAPAPGASPWIPVAPATYYISEVLDRQLHYVMGTAFAVLSVFFGLLSVRYMGIDRKVLRRMLVFHPRRLGALTMVMSFVFVTRAALNFYDAITLSASPGATWIALHIGSGHDQSVWTVALFLVWEIIPTMLILLTIATPHGGGGRWTNSADAYGAFGQISVMSGDLLQDGGGGAGDEYVAADILDPTRWRWSADYSARSRQYGGGLGGGGGGGLGGGSGDDDEDDEVAARRWLEEATCSRTIAATTRFLRLGVRRGAGGRARRVAAGQRGHERWGAFQFGQRRRPVRTVAAGQRIRVPWTRVGRQLGVGRRWDRQRHRAGTAPCRRRRRSLRRPRRLWKGRRPRAVGEGDADARSASVDLSSVGAQGHAGRVLVPSRLGPNRGAT